jgi:hypothetical protein
MDVVVALLKYYGFEFGDRSSLKELIKDWNKYTPHWVRLAIVECIYQGRYKVRSVDQILKLWQRRGATSCHFNHEFERLVCGDFVYSVPGGVKPSSASSNRTNPRAQARSGRTSANRTKPQASAQSSKAAIDPKAKLGQSTQSAQTAKLSMLAKQASSANAANPNDRNDRKSSNSASSHSAHSKDLNQSQDPAVAKDAPRSPLPLSQAQPARSTTKKKPASQVANPISKGSPKATASSQPEAQPQTNSQNKQTQPSRKPKRSQSTAPKSTTSHSSAQPANQQSGSRQIARKSAAYRSAMRNMELLAESSLFVDKLKSMCQEPELGDQTIAPDQTAGKLEQSSDQKTTAQEVITESAE